MRRESTPYSSLLVHLAVLLTYVACAFILFSFAWQNPRQLSIGAPGDPSQTMWLLGWPAYALAHGANPLLSTHIDYPGGVNLMWTPTTFAPALLATPVLQHWGLVVTFDLLMTLSPAISAWAAYLAIYRLVPSRVGACAGGLLYGFSPFIQGQSLGHLHLVMAWTPPLVLLLLHELLINRRWRVLLTGAALGVVAGLQVYTSTEILFTTMMVAAIGLAVLALIALRRRISLAPAMGALARGGTMAVVVGLLIGGPALATMYFGPNAVKGNLQPHDIYVTDLASLVIPDALYLIAPQQLSALTATFTGWPGEWNGYLGVGLLALLAGAAWRWWRQPLVQWAALTAGTVLVLSLGPHLHVFGRQTHIPLPWRVLDRLPFFQHVLPGRLMLFFFLCAGLLLALFVQRAIILSDRPLQCASAAAAVLLSLALLLPGLPRPTIPASAPTFFTGSAVQRVPTGSVALVAPYAVATSPETMYWQAIAGYRFRMPEGYATHPTKGLVFNPAPSATGDALIAIQRGSTTPATGGTKRHRMACELANWHVKTVIVGPMAHQDQAVALLSSVLGRAPDQVGGVDVWWDVASTC